MNAGLTYDRRTRAGQEREIIERIAKYGGFSVFWITENQKRAHAADRLENAGVIYRDNDDGPHLFPWIKMKIDARNIEWKIPYA